MVRTTGRTLTRLDVTPDLHEGHVYVLTKYGMCTLGILIISDNIMTYVPTYLLTYYPRN